MEQNYINQLINSRANARVITINGFQIHGRIVDQNAEAVIIKANKVEKLVFKHAISTIEPVVE